MPAKQFQTCRQIGFRPWVWACLWMCGTLCYLLIASTAVAQGPRLGGIEPMSHDYRSSMHDVSATETSYLSQADQPPLVSSPTIVDRGYASQEDLGSQYHSSQIWDSPTMSQPEDLVYPEDWGWTLLPSELLFQSFQGGPREPRLAQQVLYVSGQGWVWELEAGSRVGLVRFGTPDQETPPGQRPQGWQIDLEGAAFPRLNIESFMEVDAVDFKVGIPLTYSTGNWQFELTWYHISSHVGDEYLLRYPTFDRLDYLRDSVTFAVGYFVTPDLRLYGEADYAYNTNGGSEPWHFQFGFDYLPVVSSQSIVPVPFVAVNGSLREEVNYSGGVNVFAGLMWENPHSHHRFRAGLQYYNGKSFQYSFYDTFEEMLGFGMWYDF
jgi:hypothetical protein